MFLVLVLSLASTPKPVPPVCLRAGDGAVIALVVITKVPDRPELIPGIGLSHLERLAAQVVVRSGQKVVAQTATGSNGEACVVVPAGEYTVGVSASGFTGTVLRGVKVGPGAQVERTIELVRGHQHPTRKSKPVRQ